MNSEKREQLTSVGTGAQTAARTAGPWYADWYGLKFCVRRDTGDDHPARCTERMPEKFATLSEARAAADHANQVSP